MSDDGRCCRVSRSPPAVLASRSVQAPPVPTAIPPFVGRYVFTGRTAVPERRDLPESSWALAGHHLASCARGAASPDATFVLAVPKASRVVLSTRGSDYDTALHAYRIAYKDAPIPPAADAAHHRRGAPNEIACNDDVGLERTSRLDLALTPGRYLIVVDGYGHASAGAFRLTVDTTRLDEPMDRPSAVSDPEAA